jgi:hypothetical protein
MPTITLKAHFDGKQILLDEPFVLKPNTALLVTIVESSEGERDDWINLSSAGLSYAYGQEEPDYSLNLIKEPNPDYERR